VTGGTDIDRIRPELVDWRRLAHRCAQLSAEKRPTIVEVLDALRQLEGSLGD
jgi:hypothetical protein